MTHKEILHRILTGFAELPGVLFRLNVVAAASGDRYIRSAPKGVSDLIGFLCVGGKAVFVAIEVKASKDTLRPEQESFLDAVEHYGGIALVSRDAEETLEILRDYVERKPIDR